MSTCLSPSPEILAQLARCRRLRDYAAAVNSGPLRIRIRNFAKASTFYDVVDGNLVLRPGVGLGDCQASIREHLCELRHSWSKFRTAKISVVAVLLPQGASSIFHVMAVLGGVSPAHFASGDAPATTTVTTIVQGIQKDMPLRDWARVNRASAVMIDEFPVGGWLEREWDDWYARCETFASKRVRVGCGRRAGVFTVD